MKKVFFTIAISIGVAAGLKAQQQPLLSQYMLNNYFLNPAYSGSGEQMSFTVLHRTQWAGYENYQGSKASQQCQLFDASLNLDSTGHNAGLQFVRDEQGSIRSTSIQLSYAYRIPVTEKSTLALGVRGGITSRSIDFGEYIIKHPGDALIPEGKQTETKPGISLGVWYEHKKYYAGISAKGMVIQSGYETLGIQNEKLFTATAGYHVTVNKDWTFTPSTQVVSNTERTFIDGSIVIKNNEAFWTGVSYRNQEAITLLVGFGMLERKLRISYAFDYVTSNKSVKADTSHEIMARYYIGWLHSNKKKPQADRKN